MFRGTKMCAAHYSAADTVGRISVVCTWRAVAHPPTRPPALLPLRDTSSAIITKRCLVLRCVARIILVVLLLSRRACFCSARVVDELLRHCVFLCVRAFVCCLPPRLALKAKTMGLCGARDHFFAPHPAARLKVFCLIF
jgi:hypothetical protein